MFASFAKELVIELLGQAVAEVKCLGQLPPRISWVLLVMAVNMTWIHLKHLQALHPCRYNVCEDVWIDCCRPTLHVVASYMVDRGQGGPHEIPHVHALHKHVPQGELAALCAPVV